MAGSSAYVEALKLCHLEFIARALAPIHQLSDQRLIVQLGLGSMVARKPEAIIAEDAWSAYPVEDLLHPLRRL